MVSTPKRLIIFLHSNISFDDVLGIHSVSATNVYITEKEKQLRLQNLHFFPWIFSKLRDNYNFIYRVVAMCREVCVCVCAQSLSCI